MPVKSPLESITAIQLLLKYLKAEGVEYIFGIPGGPLMPLYEAIHETSSIQPILTKHEEGAAFMADGYARVRRGLGVCCMTTGPGSTNAMTGIATSFSDGIPILVITAQVSTNAFGRGAIQESSPQGINVVEMFKSVTKASLMLPRPDKMGEVIRYLLRVALSGRPGPVHLNIPADFAKRDIPNETVQPIGNKNPNSYFDRKSIQESAAILCRAKRPAILAGNGINLSGAYDELKRLSEKLMIPVATTVKAKGAFPEDHLLSLGVFGFAGSPRAESYLLSGQVDVLLAIGTSLGEDATNGWDAKLQPKEALLQIEIDPHQIGKNYPVKVSLIGDAKTVLTELIYQLDREMQWIENRYRSRQEILEFRKEHPRCFQEEKINSSEMPLKPQRLMNDLDAVLPRNSIIFCDIGNHMAWALHYLCINHPHSMFHCLGFSAMGYGMNACIGAKLAAPERPVIAIVGDGSFAMNGMEVHTACEYNIPVIWLVMNNGGYGMIYHGEKIQFKNRFHNSLFKKPMNIHKLAESLGALSARISKPGEICSIMNKALSLNRPAVIDAIIDAEEIPPVGARMKSLDKFFESHLGQYALSEKA